MPVRMSTSFFFNDTATTEIYTLSLHDALPISISTLERASPVCASSQRDVCSRPATYTRLPLWAYCAAISANLPQVAQRVHSVSVCVWPSASVHVRFVATLNVVRAVP